MEVPTLDNSDIMKYLDLENTSGLMAKCMKENGKITKCMAEERLCGEMERGTQQPKIKTVDALKKLRLPILVESLLHFLKLFSYITYNY